MKALEMAKLFSDKDTLRILADSFKFPKTAQELSEELDIPIAVCYKKIKKLANLDLIKCVDTKLSSKGKSVRCFRSQVKSTYIFFDQGKLRVRMELTRLEDRISDQMWDIVKEIKEGSRNRERKPREEEEEVDEDEMLRDDDDELGE